jgi:hypothetical protein
MSIAHHTYMVGWKVFDVVNKKLVSQVRILQTRRGSQVIDISKEIQSMISHRVVEISVNISR